VLSAALQLDDADLRELYDVRHALEIAAALVAVQRATADDHVLVRKACRDLDKAITSRDKAAYHVMSRRFHVALLAPSGMKRLLGMYESAWNLAAASRPISSLSSDELSTLHADHGRIAAAYIAKDGTALAAELRQHHVDLRAAVTSSFEGGGLVGSPQATTAAPARSPDRDLSQRALEGRDRNQTNRRREDGPDTSTRE